MESPKKLKWTSILQRDWWDKRRDAARSAGVAWNAEDLLLTPQQKLVQLVNESRRLALQGEADEPSNE